MGQIPSDLAQCLWESAKCSFNMIRCSYVLQYRLQQTLPTRVEMRKNYPRCRLNINGDPVNYH